MRSVWPLTTRGGVFRAARSPLSAETRLNLSWVISCGQSTQVHSFWRPAYPVSAEVIDVFRRWRECPEVQEALRRTSLLPIGVNHGNDPDRRRNFFLRMLSDRSEDRKLAPTMGSDPAVTSQQKPTWPIDLGNGR